MPSAAARRNADDGRNDMRRILLAAIVVICLVQAMFWAFLAVTYYVAREFSLGPVRAEVVTERTAIALGCAVLLALNVTALNLFWGQRRAYAVWLLAAVEVVDLVTNVALRYRFVGGDSFEVSSWTFRSVVSAVVVLLTFGVRSCA